MPNIYEAWMRHKDSQENFKEFYCSRAPLNARQKHRILGTLGTRAMLKKETKKSVFSTTTGKLT